MKYKVVQNGQFLGHWQAHTPEEAIKKAVENYGAFYKINVKDYFDVTSGRYHHHLVGEE